MVRAANMKLVVEKATLLIIVNISGGGCPDVPYLAGPNWWENRLWRGRQRPRDIGHTLCGYALELAYTEMEISKKCSPSVGTVPRADAFPWYPLRKVVLKGDADLSADTASGFPVNRGTPALLAAAAKTLQVLRQGSAGELHAFLVGDIGLWETAAAKLYRPSHGPPAAGHAPACAGVSLSAARCGLAQPRACSPWRKCRTGAAPAHCGRRVSCTRPK